MLVNIELSIEDREWPIVKMVIRHGNKVEVVKTVYSEAVEKFKSKASSFTVDATQMLIDRRIK